MLPQVWPAILTLGWILLAIAAGEGAMAAFAFAAGDGEAGVFAASAAITLLFAGGCILTTKGRPFQLRFRDAALLTAAAWFVVPFFAALPLVADPIGLSLVDAYFEMVSGLTTTGSTVMAGLDHAAPTVLLWRSTVQWIGGIGIIGFAIVILPFLKIGGMQLFRLESSDRSENALPRVREVARAVLGVYLLLTLSCFIAYWALGMTVFQAINHAFTTICTGGFSTSDLSFSLFDNPAVEWVGVLFMALGAMPFLSLLRLTGRGRMRDRIDPQIVAFLGTLAVATLVLAAWVHFRVGLDVGPALTKSAFNVVSVITTTGYASTDYLTWGAFAAGWMLILTFVGGCTGSTGGGIKIFRFQVIYRVVRQHARQVLQPHAVMPLSYGGRRLSDEQAASVGVFVFLYIVTFAVVAGVLALLGMDLTTSLSAAATAIGNVGPGVSVDIGPVGNFAGLSDAAKLLLCMAMIMGRIEILGVMVLFVPSFYR